MFRNLAPIALLTMLLALLLALGYAVLFPLRPFYDGKAIVELGNAKFRVGDDVASSLDISGRAVSAPIVDTLPDGRIPGRWTMVDYTTTDGEHRRFLEHAYEIYPGVWIIQFYDITNTDIQYARQSFECEANPGSTRSAEDGNVGHELLVSDDNGDEIPEIIIFRYFEPNFPAEGTDDTFPPCPKP